MNRGNENHQSNISLDSDFINVKQLFLIIWQSRILIAFAIFFSFSGSIYYSLNMNNVYKIEATLAPADTFAKGGSTLSSQYSGLASFAGVSLPSSGSDRIAEGIEIIKSLDFFENFVNNYDLFLGIIASESWDSASNKILYDPKIYDIKQKKWLSDDRFSLNGKPSIQSAHRFFISNLGISEDKKTGFINISYKHYSPYFAKHLLDSIIIEINNIVRLKDIEISERSIEYLQQEQKKNTLSSLKTGINSLIQNEIESMTIANSSPEYLFKVLSKPYVNEIKFAPNRFLIVISLTLFGFMLSIILVLLRSFFKNSLL